MELTVRNKRFEDLFKMDEFTADTCICMPVDRKGNNEAEEGTVFHCRGFMFCVSDESQDFFICKMSRTADQFTDEECIYIRECKCLRPCDEVTEIDAYVTGFDNKSAVEVIYDSCNINDLHTQDKLDAVNILQDFAIDNVEKQIDVEFKNNIIKISDIKE